MKNWMTWIIIGILLAVIISVSADIAITNSRITNLESQLATLSQDLSNVHSSVSNYDDIISSLNNSIAVINNNITSLESNLNNIKSTISNLNGQDTTVEDLLVKVEPSVVRIDVNGPYFEGSASGIIISNYCCVLTCYHIVNGATTINVTLDSGEIFSATILLWYKGRDIAILQMDTGRFDFPFDFPAAIFGSSSAMAVGDDVVSVGYTRDLLGAPSVTSGIISAFRILEDGYEYIEVQTDAATNADDEGGPLINMKGAVIGINAAVETYDSGGNQIANIKYYIPIDEAKNLIKTAMGIFDENIDM